MFNAQQLSTNPTFQRIARGLSLLTGIVFVGLCFAFLTRSPLARALWPWGYTTLSELSYTFLASIMIAIACPVLWIGISGELAAARGGTIDMLVTYLGSAIFMLQTYSTLPSSTGQRVLNGAIVCLAICAGVIMIWWVTRGLTYKDTRPMPRIIRGSFAFFAVALIIVGGLLILKQPVFPWQLSGEASIMYGWIFMGAAAYFIYGWLYPYWSNAAGQLAGFLAYDIILIVPFVTRYASIEPEYRLSLTIYIGVLLYSGALAIYFLFIYPETRWRLRRT